LSKRVMKELKEGVKRSIESLKENGV
jgi:hypothetical protein